MTLNPDALSVSSSLHGRDVSAFARSASCTPPAARPARGCHLPHTSQPPSIPAAAAPTSNGARAKVGAVCSESESAMASWSASFSSITRSALRAPKSHKCAASSIASRTSASAILPCKSHPTLSEGFAFFRAPVGLESPCMLFSLLPVVCTTRRGLTRDIFSLGRLVRVLDTWQGIRSTKEAKRSERTTMGRSCVHGAFQKHRRPPGPAYRFSAAVAFHPCSTSSATTASCRMSCARTQADRPYSSTSQGRGRLPSARGVESSCLAHSTSPRAAAVKISVAMGGACA
mmetsp:Transcript_48640/g.103751  ORF Transcript_48640/g.103751 Transcript_48640/m.103751 type:complete len:287 (+) Transcript_48640:949-1809(+)